VVDKLVKVFRKDGKEEWLLVHIEVQGPTARSKRLQFAERMFRYFYRVFDRHRKPVTGIAIFTGGDGRRMPDRFEYEFLNTRLIYQYNTLSILDFPDKELEASNNPFATVVLVAKKSLLKGKGLDNRLLEQKLMIVRLLKEKGFSERKVRAIMIFLHNSVRFEKPEMNRIFVKEVDHIFSKTNFMGIAEQLAEIRATEALKVGIKKGREEGLEEGKENASRIFVENLLKDGLYTQDKIASLANVSLAFVKKVKKEQRSK